MFDYVDELAFTNDQGARAQKLFAAVVLAALDDAIADDKKYGNGAEVIARWARSRDGREVLMCAGIDPNERTVKGMMEFVRRGVRTSVALSREESERQAAARSADDSGAHFLGAVRVGRFTDVRKFLTLDIQGGADDPEPYNQQVADDDSCSRP
jgi:hypothetical protein